jgi:hypothetical protein
MTSTFAFKLHTGIHRELLIALRGPQTAQNEVITQQIHYPHCTTRASRHAKTYILTSEGNRTSIIEPLQPALTNPE